MGGAEEEESSTEAGNEIGLNIRSSQPPLNNFNLPLNLFRCYFFESVANEAIPIWAVIPFSLIIFYHFFRSYFPLLLSPHPEKMSEPIDIGALHKMEYIQLPYCCSAQRCLNPLVVARVLKPLSILGIYRRVHSHAPRRKSRHPRFA